MVRGYRLCTREVLTWQSGQGTQRGIEVMWSVIWAAVSSTCQASKDSVVLSGKK
jgi:hypothetical protein